MKITNKKLINNHLHHFHYHHLQHLRRHHLQLLLQIFIENQESLHQKPKSITHVKKKNQETHKNQPPYSLSPNRRLATDIKQPWQKTHNRATMTKET